MALDYASILSAGRQLVPDLRQQMMQDEARSMQREQFDWLRQQREAQQQQAVQQQERQAQFRADFEAAATANDPSEMVRLYARYPEMAENIKPAWEAMEEGRRRTDLTQINTIRSRLDAGDVAGATDAFRQRVEADRAAGQADADDEAMLAALESGDPTQVRFVQNMIHGVIAQIVGPDKYAETLGELSPSENKTPVQREYEWRVQQKGQEAADRWLATQDESLVTVEPGGSVYRKSDFVNPPAGGSGVQPRGGDQSALVGYAMPVQGGTFTSQFGASRDGGSRSHNGLDIAAPAGSPVSPVKPGKVVAVSSDPRSGNFVRVKHPDGTVSSYSHLGQQNVRVGQDVGPGDTLGTVGETGNATGNVLHLVVRDKNGRAVDPAPLLGGPVKVRSKQEYDRLPSGTAYIAPDGSQRVKG